ncbi:hypothetical protein Tco_0739991 [Tanacetum coccineum]
MARAYTAGSSENKEYARTLPPCNKCKLHHNVLCTVKYANCKKVGHMAQDYRSPTATANQRTLTCFECGSPTATANQRTLTCFECGSPTAIGNQTGNDEARGRVYPLGGGETDQDPNNIADDIKEGFSSSYLVKPKLELP